jgi:secondary thiamine-phosphate synthase enzyme
MEVREIAVETGRKPSVTDLTDACAGFLRDVDAVAGMLTVFVPHATAGLVIIELGAGSDADLLQALDQLLPRDDRWRHAHGSPGHGADHVLPLFLPPSLSVPVVDGHLSLGTWQSIALVDPNRDNPSRLVRLAYVPG